MSTEETTRRSHTCDPDEYNNIAEANSQAAGYRGAVRSPSCIDFGPEVLLVT